jgi:hypothetical protein
MSAVDRIGSLRRRAVLAWLAAAAAARAGPAAADGEAETVPWERLLAPGWAPRRSYDASGLGRMEDGDPEAQQALAALRAVWDRAPPDPALEGRRLRLAGYMLPVDADREAIRDFLLVPYFGACLHEPAPPANQVVHVLPERPMPAAARGTGAVWATGTLQVRRSDTRLGVAAYRLLGARVEPRAG